ncbi:MAG: ABC transporter permease [Thermoguttaceae bacterium]|jgi:ABC-type lipoprotein release transport system permease subunit|nr:ABC transporter permease [Thermoguttaceae bacterium]
MGNIVQELWNGGAGTVVFLLVVSAEAILMLLAAGRVPLVYSLRNLAVRWKTTLMTALAFTLVIAVLTVMLAFVEGMRRLTRGTGEPGNVIVLAEGNTDETFSNLPVGDLTDIEQQAAVVRDPRGRPLASRECYMIVNQPFPDAPPGKPKRRFLQVRGIDDAPLAAAVHNLSLLAGAWFSPAGVEEIQLPNGRHVTAVQGVLGRGIAEELGRARSDADRAAARNPDRLEVGDLFELGERTWIVAGIMDSEATTFNSEIWAKRTVAGPMVGKQGYTTLVVRTAGPGAARRFKDFLERDYDKAKVKAFVETEYYTDLSQTTDQFLFAIAVVTFFIAIGGMFGVMNTMFAAVSQRRQDIGVLRLLGYGRRQILISFLLESLVIALVGGLLGCGAGLLADGWSATSVITGHAGGGKFVVFRLVVDAQILGVGLLLALVMGALGGLVPAWTAMRLRPLEALR